MTMTLIKLSYNSKLIPDPGLVLQTPLCKGDFEEHHNNFTQAIKSEFLYMHKELRQMEVTDILNELVLFLVCLFICFNPGFWSSVKFTLSNQQWISLHAMSAREEQLQWMEVTYIHDCVMKQLCMYTVIFLKVWFFRV